MGLGCLVVFVLALFIPEGWPEYSVAACFVAIGTRSLLNLLDIGDPEKRLAEIRFQQQCEREAVKARRARWKAKKLAEREAARAGVSDETHGG